MAAPARKRGRKARPPINVVRSWIWEVFTPQLDHLRYELEVLGKTLSFQPHSGTFERLLPLRDALQRDEQHVFNDLRGDLPEYDRLVDRHDTALDSLRTRADALFVALTKSDAFRACFHSALSELRAEGSEHLPSPQDETTWLAYIAADVVNDLPPDLPARYSDFELWNRAADRFKNAAPSSLRQQLSAERNRFGATAREAHQELFALRKGLSRKYDVPVAPILGRAVESALD